MNKNFKYKFIIIIQRSFLTNNNGNDNDNQK